MHTDVRLAGLGQVGGVLARADRDRAMDTWQRDPRVTELSLGDPHVAWKREHRSGVIEFGLAWSNVSLQQASAVFLEHGYDLDREAPDRVPSWRRGTTALARLRGELWWSATP